MWLQDLTVFCNFFFFVIFFFSLQQGMCKFPGWTFFFFLQLFRDLGNYA